MSTNQIASHAQNVPPTINEIPPNHNITLGGDQSDRRDSFHPNPVNSFSQNYAIQFELKNISREVSRIAQKGRYLGQSLPMTVSMSPYDRKSNGNQLEIDLSNVLNFKANATQLGKYNYYGRQYRFEAQNPSESLQKPMQANSYSNKEEQELKSFSPTTRPAKKRQELNMPDSQSYYIYFDQPKMEKEFSQSVKPKLYKAQSQNVTSAINNNNSSDVFIGSKNHSTALYNSLNFTKLGHHDRLNLLGDDEERTPPLHVFSKQGPESKWVLEKKVKRLEKQLGQLKKRQQQRDKLKNFSSNQPKKDSKVYVGKQVDQLINSLWP